MADPKPEGATAEKGKSAIRGSLRLEISAATPAITSGANFSIFVTIQNPFDVPVTIYQVLTHIPVELYDISSLRIYRARSSETRTRSRTTEFLDRVLGRDIENSQNGVAVAVGPEFSPETQSSAITIAQHVGAMGAESSIQGIAFNFPQNPKLEDLDRIYLRLDGMRKGQVPVTLQPGDTLVRQFVLRTRRMLFFSPLAYSFRIQVNYAMDEQDHYDTVSYNVNIRSSLTSVSVGSICGALIGSVLKALSTNKTGGVGVWDGLNAALIAALASLAVVIAFARKASAQPIVSVEDFWGGALIGFSVGFFGLDNFLYLFKSPGSH
jgi:hypothetical protein